MICVTCPLCSTVHRLNSPMAGQSFVCRCGQRVQLCLKKRSQVQKAATPTAGQREHRCSPHKQQCNTKGNEMTSNRHLLSKIVGDFDTLYRAYELAGLLAEDASSEAASKLLGSGDDIYRFKREFLLAEALIRNRVGRLVYGDNRLRHLAVFGGNNVGKSTVLNILAAEKVTSTSPEGGHVTVHGLRVTLVQAHMA
jgi:hypothetical protein